MSFVSVEFILLVTITLAIYYLPPFRNWQPLVMVAAGLVFYGYDNHYRSLLLICSALINFIASYVCLSSQNKRLRVLSTTMGVILNLFLLIFFKYGRALALGLDPHFTGTGEIGSLIGDLTMPIGLSFFTFQGISLLVDALRNKISEQVQGAIKSSFRTRVEMEDPTTTTGCGDELYMYRCAVITFSCQRCWLRCTSGLRRIRITV